MTPTQNDQNADAASLDLEAIKARAAAATEGPWEWDDPTISQHWSRPEPWVTVVDNEVRCGSYCYGGSVRPIESDADGQFIAHAREDVPALVAEVERLRGLLSAVVDDITAEMNLARQAYRSTPTDHFAHDYCRWVGHAEAYSNALNFIDRNKEAH